MSFARVKLTYNLLFVGTLASLLVWVLRMCGRLPISLLPKDKKCKTIRHKKPNMRRTQVDPHHKYFDSQQFCVSFIPLYKS